MTSINYNAGAAAALAALQATNRQLETVQGQVSTGLKVQSAKDNASSWAIAATMKSDVSAFKTIGEGMSMASSTVAIGRDAAESVTDLLRSVKDRIVQAQGSNVDRTKIGAEITSLASEITSIIDAAQFNGENVLKGTGTMEVLASLDRASDGTVTPSKISVARQDLATSVDLSTIDVSDDTNAATALGAIDAMIDASVEAAAALGSSEARLEIQSEFVSKLTDGMEAGISALVDADMTEASAQLKALQTQQQLGVQSLSIANKASEALLNLFR